MSLTIKTKNGARYAHVVFTAMDPEGHRQEVEEAMNWIKLQPDNQARALFEGMHTIAIGEHMDYYRLKATEAKPKCGAFAFVGLSGLKSTLFNYIILFARMPMKMIPTVAEAETWVSEAKV